MSNVLNEHTRQQVLALGRLGWSLLRIEEATGVRRETASGYLKAAGVPVRGRGGRPRAWPPTPATTLEVSTDPYLPDPATRAPVSLAPAVLAPPGRAPRASTCEPYRDLIVDALGRGRNAMAIWQDLVDDHGFPGRYASVRRVVVPLRDRPPVEARVVITTARGEAAQVDYGEGPMVRHPDPGQYRRTRLFVLTVGYSRKAVRVLVWRSRSRIWAELHERAVRRLGGPVPLEPFRYDQYGVRTVPLDGCVEVEAASYGIPPGWIGRRVDVQGHGATVRVLHPTTGQLLGEHLRAPRGWHQIADADRPARTPATTLALLAAGTRAGPSVGTLCDHIHQHDGAAGVRRILGVLSRVKTHGPAHAAAGRPTHPATVPLPRSHRSQNRRRLMNLVELDRALRQLRLSGMAAVLERRLLQAQTEQMAPIDLVAALVADERQRRQDRLLARRHTPARFRDPDRALDSFEFTFNRKMNRARVYELATARVVAQREDARFLGPPGTGKSPLAQAIGRAAIQQGYRVLYREAHTLLEALAEATLAVTRQAYLAELTAVPLLIIADLGIRTLPHTAAEDLLELIMRRYERASTLLTSHRPVDDWGKLLGDTAAVTALLDRLLHHAHVLKCGPRSWRTQLHTDVRAHA